MALLTPHIHWPARAQLSPWAAGASARSRVLRTADSGYHRLVASAPGHAPAFATAEHGDLQPDGAAAGIAVVAGHRQLEVGTDGVVVVQRLLEGGWPLRRDLGFRLRPVSYRILSPNHLKRNAAPVRPGLPPPHRLTPLRRCAILGPRRRGWPGLGGASRAAPNQPRCLPVGVTALCLPDLP